MQQLFLTLPLHLGGVLVSYTDLKSRVVIRSHVIFTILAQLMFWCAFLPRNTLAHTISHALLGGGLAGLIQWACLLIIPRSVGVGDITSSILVGTVLGGTSVYAWILWWPTMSLYSLVWLSYITLRKKLTHNTSVRNQQTIAFAPIIFLSGELSLLFGH